MAARVCSAVDVHRMKPNHEKYGLTPKQWDDSKKEARETMVGVARSRQMITSTMLDYDECSRCFFRRLPVERARLTRCMVTSFRACAGLKRGSGRDAWSRSRTLAVDKLGSTSISKTFFKRGSR